MKLDSTTFLYISNIPPNYHAFHLRNFFSQYVESSRFICFHFRHRPSLFPAYLGPEVSALDFSSALDAKFRDKSSLCAIISLSTYEAPEFIAAYSGMHWLDAKDGWPINPKCEISTIDCTEPVISNKLENLIEFKPPKWMPRGNVGTPGSHFLQLIKECKLESSIITKLHLDFTMHKRDRKYGAVPYNYELEFNPSSKSPTRNHFFARSAQGQELLNDDEFSLFGQINEQTEGKSDTCAIPLYLMKQSEIEDNDDDIPEEWDRFESLHDDPYYLERGNKANLKYEDKIELVWEKGGPGLVFHTDEFTWRKLDPLRKEEIFDEPSSFDWDIDMQPYESAEGVGSGPTPNGNFGSLRDTCELIDINRSRENIHTQDFSFDPKKQFKYETVLKGYGSRLMKKMGWKPGSKLGAVKHQYLQCIGSCPGLLVPLTSEGSLPPKVRTGLGYRKAIIKQPRIKPITVPPGNSSTYIRTIFDSSETVAARINLGLTASLLRRNDPAMIVKWLSDQKDIKSNTSEKLLNDKNLQTNRTVIINKHSVLSKEGISFVSGGLLKPLST